MKGRSEFKASIVVLCRRCRWRERLPTGPLAPHPALVHPAAGGDVHPHRVRPWGTGRAGFHHALPPTAAERRDVRLVPRRRNRRQLAAKPRAHHLIHPSLSHVTRRLPAGEGRHARSGRLHGEVHRIHASARGPSLSPGFVPRGRRTRHPSQRQPQIPRGQQQPPRLSQQQHLIFQHHHDDSHPPPQQQ